MFQKTTITCFIAGLLMGSLMAFAGTGSTTTASEVIAVEQHGNIEALHVVRAGRSLLHPVGFVHLSLRAV